MEEKSESRCRKEKNIVLLPREMKLEKDIRKDFPIMCSVHLHIMEKVFFYLFRTPQLSSEKCSKNHKFLYGFLPQKSFH